MTTQRPERLARFSVLDTSPIVSGSTAREALERTLDLARCADVLGCERFWVAEHHGMKGVASAVPAVSIARLAAATSSLRLGSGGVMLPNHTPFSVAEQFGMLEAYYPGRIDLAVGRAPGGTKGAVDAVRPAEERRSLSFPEQVDELDGWFAYRPGRPRALPAEDNRPVIWILGSSSASAEVAAARGLPYAFAHHLNPRVTAEAVETYRHRFEPSAHLAAPRVLISASVVAADDDDEAEWLAGSTRLKVLRRRHGRPIRLPPPEQAARYPYTPQDRAFVAAAADSVHVGGPQRLRQQLRELVERTATDEVMVTSPVHAHRARLRSYEITARVLDGVTPARGRGAGVR